MLVYGMNVGLWHEYGRDLSIYLYIINMRVFPTSYSRATMIAS